MTGPTPWRRRAVSAPEAAILFHPDQRTPWAPSLVVHLAQPLTPALAARRLAELAAVHPLLDARLESGTQEWVAGSRTLHVSQVAAAEGVLRSRFALAAEAPLRVALAAAGTKLVVVGHHAALDGRALVMVAAALLGDGNRRPGAATAASVAPSAPAIGGRRSAVGRLRRPADRVAPSEEPPAEESFAAADAPPGARLRVAELAGAAVAAAGGWNAERGAPWAQIGLTIPVGGPDVLGNVSTHRRLDLALPADVAAAVEAALIAADPPPGEALTPARARLLRLLRPVVDRLSDSLLVSNLGRVELPGARAVDFYPQARGRSAVAVGACTPIGGSPRLTLRARDLTEEDARRLLAGLVGALSG